MIRVRFPPGPAAAGATAGLTSHPRGESQDATLRLFGWQVPRKDSTAAVTLLLGCDEIVLLGTSQASRQARIKLRVIRPSTSARRRLPSAAVSTCHLGQSGSHIGRRTSSIMSHGHRLRT